MSPVTMVSAVIGHYQVWWKIPVFITIGQRQVAWKVWTFNKHQVLTLACLICFLTVCVHHLCQNVLFENEAHLQLERNILMPWRSWRQILQLRIKLIITHPNLKETAYLLRSPHLSSTTSFHVCSVLLHKFITHNALSSRIRKLL